MAESIRRFVTRNTRNADFIFLFVHFLETEVKVLKKKRWCLITHVNRKITIIIKMMTVITHNPPALHSLFF